MKIQKLLAFPTAIALMAVLSFGAFGEIRSAEAQAVGGGRLAIQLANTGLTSPIAASSDDATVARLILDTTGSTEAVRISSLPFILTTGNGAQASTLNNCRVYNEAAINTALNANMAATSTMASGINNIALDAPLVLAANTINTLALRCDVSADLTAGGTFTFSMNTANVVATGATTGLPAVVVVRGAVIIPPVVVVPPVVVTPGLPTTGAGGESTTNMMIILGSLVAAGLGISLAKRNGIKA